MKSRNSLNETVKVGKETITKGGFTPAPPDPVEKFMMAFESPKETPGEDIDNDAYRKRQNAMNHGSHRKY